MILFIFKATPPELSRTEEAAKILVMAPREIPHILVQTFGHDIYQFNVKEMTAAIRAADIVGGKLEYPQKKRYETSPHSRAYIAQDAILMEQKRAREQTGPLTTDELAISELRVLMETKQQATLRMKFDQIVNDIMDRQLFDPIIMSFEDIKAQRLTFYERLNVNIQELENLEELMNTLIKIRESLETETYFYNPHFEQLVKLWENVKENIAEKKRIAKLYKNRVIYFPQKIPPKHPKKIIFLFHGMGSNETQFDDESLHPDILYVAFRAPLRFEAIFNYGFQWAKIDSISNPDEELVRENIRVFLSDFLPFFTQFNIDLKQIFNLDNKDLIALGFSQGAIIVLKLLLATFIQNVVAISGAFDQKDPKAPMAEGKNVLLIHDPADTMVPYKRSQDAEENLQRLGTQVKLINGAKGHTLRPEDLEEVIKFALRP